MERLLEVFFLKEGYSEVYQEYQLADQSVDKLQSWEEQDLEYLVVQILIFHF